MVHSSLWCCVDAISLIVMLTTQVPVSAASKDHHGVFMDSAVPLYLD